MNTQAWNHRQLFLAICILVVSLVGLTGCKANRPAPTTQIYAISAATYLVAASDSSDASKTLANYVCDGSDDQVEIQAAIDALPTGGGKVALSEGAFSVRGDINITKDNVTLEGQGHSTIIQLPKGFSADELYMLNINASDASIMSLCLDGNRDVVKGMHTGMHVENCTRLTVDHVWMQNLTGDGLLGASRELHLTNSFFYNISDDAADVNAFVYSVIANCTFRDIGDNGVDTDGAIHSSITGNTFNSCGGVAIELEQELNPGYTEYCTASNNTMKDCRIGILLNSGRYNSIAGNVMLECTTGIHLMAEDEYYSTHNVITGNIIQGDWDGEYGIKEEDPNQDYNLIGLNIIEIPSGENIVISGAHTKIYD